MFSCVIQGVKMWPTLTHATDENCSHAHRNRRRHFSTSHGLCLGSPRLQIRRSEGNITVFEQRNYNMPVTEPVERRRSSGTYWCEGEDNEANY